MFKLLKWVFIIVMVIVAWQIVMGTFNSIYWWMDP